MAKVISTEAVTENEVKKVVVEKRNTGSTMFTLGKINNYLMIAGLILVAIGFMCMAGGRSEDPNVFDPKEIYSFRRINLAPTLVVLGFLVEIVAILYVPKDAE
jgi:hypothetical protein